MESKQTTRCPKCGRDNLDRIPRHFLTRMLLPDSKKMKCRLCGANFYVHSKPYRPTTG